ncbi:RecQ family ATP-dependent DNA helicase [Lebetimonas sp. JH369]|uniref:RecQ family ATP-dependent DNA helicase n=1 Tax=Lebetimonas sp. JH369 TaxID=990069 RepID=UPI0004632136|nr:RecQ family ATP-dependent DNA helicase [Lebetimonas sp. JH369]
MKLLEIGEVNYKQLNNLIKNRYFVYSKDWEFIDYDDMDEYDLPTKKYWLKEDINDLKELSDKYLIVKCLNFEKLNLDEKNLIKYIQNVLNYNLIFFDIDTINGEKRAGVQPGSHLFTLDKFTEFLKNQNINFIGGHNIVNYDIPQLLYNQGNNTYEYIKKINFIDTLYLSILLNRKSSHALEKEYKKEEKQNNPIKDAEESLTIFSELCTNFKVLPKNIKCSLFYLLKNNEYYKGFFKYIGLDLIYCNETEIFNTINQCFNLDKDYINKYPLEIAIIFLSKYFNKSVPLFAYKNIENLKKVKNDLILKSKQISLKSYIKTLSNNDEFEFRKFKPLEDDLFNDDISQEDIIKYSLDRENILAILPTGGGKSLCYQIPAIFDAEHYNQLTLIISPLRSLMKDQIDGFNSKYNTSIKAGALSGFLTPNERIKLIEDAKNGKVSLLYIAPESLRFKTIRNILKNRDISRVVIDEAHCISMWGHDFRPDYRYIGDFLKEMYQDDIPPISLFSATASKEVIEDIKTYFYDKLKIKFKEFIADNKRKNLIYKVIKVNANKNNVFEEKYKKLLNLVKPKQIIYIPNSIKDCDEVANKLNIETGYRVESFHSKKENREEILQNFINNYIDIIVSTTAFGMGVDKPDIESVIHFTSSQNIEDYMQESGRAGRDEKIVPKAECITLYYEGDFDKYLHKLKNSIITRDEIQAVYQALKDFKKDKIYITPVDLAIKSKLSIDVNNNEYKHKLDDIIAELVEEGLIERETNNYTIYANSIEINDLQKVKELLEISDEKINLAFEVYRFIKKKSRKSLDISEAAYVLGKNEKDIIQAIRELKEKGIISEDKKIHFQVNKPIQWMYFTLERFLITEIINNEKEILKLREIAEKFKQSTNKNFQRYNKQNNKKLIETLERILNNWKEFVEVKRLDKKLSLWSIRIQNLTSFQDLINKRLNNTYKIYKECLKDKNEIKLSEIRNTIPELKEKEINDYLVYMHYSKFITLIDGVIIYYPQYVLKIKRFVNQYTNEMYNKRKKLYYENKRKKIHIMNEFLIRQINSNNEEFLKTYFIMPIDDFIKHYVKFVKKYINYFITKTKYKEIFENLTSEQKEIVKSKKKQILILAGPGSGKTKTLVNKIANLILNNEKVNPELFLMLTYTRTAMIEFKDRLYNLIGSDIYKLDIHTFHSYLYYILGENNKDLIKNRERESDYIFDKFLSLDEHIKKEIVPRKTVLYLDEYQDITPKTFEIIKELIKYGEIKEIVAVGDDDQMIMEFTGSDLIYFDEFWNLLSINEKEKVSFTLSKNFRSFKNIVYFANEFIKQLKKRKKQIEITPVKQDKGILEIIKFSSSNLYDPVIKKIIEIGEIDNEIAVLTHNNDDALTLKALLKKYDIESKLILDIKKFKWYDLFEIREFDNAILNNLLEDDDILTKDVINKAYKKISYLSKSKNFYCIEELINYIRNKENFTYEAWRSLLDDLDDEFCNQSNSKIIISTFHKSKGKEFDNVIIMDKENNHNNILNEKLIRRYYVGITRAKKNLFIYTNHDYFFNKFAKNNELYKFNKNSYKEPNEMILELGLSDINLGASFDFQDKLKGVYLKDKSLILSYKNIIYNNTPIAKLSNKGYEKVVKILKKAYKIHNIKLSNLVYYFTENYDTNNKKEILQGIFK